MIFKIRKEFGWYSLCGGLLFCGGLNFFFVVLLRKNAFLDLRTVFNEAIGMLDELQNCESLACVDTLGF